MARPLRQGLTYFPLDVDMFDDLKIQLTAAKYGPISELTALKLLCLIYKNKGYYLDWNADQALLLAKSMAIKTTLIEEIITELVKRDFFDKGLFKSFSILTSHGIQTRYLAASERRKKVEIITEYLLADTRHYSRIKIEFLDVNRHAVNADKNPIDADINAVNDDIGTQIKSKETKSKEIKSKETKSEEIKSKETKENDDDDSLIISSVIKKVTDKDALTSDGQKLYHFYLERFPHQKKLAQRIDEWLTDFDFHSINYAVDKATKQENEPLHPLNYIEKILENLKASGQSIQN